MLMNMTRRIYMTLVSSYSLFFEKIAGKLNRDATQSSHYGIGKNSLMESHLGIAERQLSNIQSDTVGMVSRINELHKHRLNLVKMGDGVLRYWIWHANWASIAGSLLMLTATPITHYLGIMIMMASSIMSLAETWRGYQLEKELNQLMDDSLTSNNYMDFTDQVQNFFETNLPSSGSSYTSSAGVDADSDVIPRSVIDYENAHEYINPDDEHVQDLLQTQIFPNGIPSDQQLIVQQIHQFMADSTTYVADGSTDDWASVGDVATRLEGDCEDLANLETSLILAAFNEQGFSTSAIQTHAAYVSVNDNRLGHVYLSMELNGEQVVIDPSLKSGELISLNDYVTEYQVEDVFTYNQSQTNVINPQALGLETSGF